MAVDHDAMAADCSVAMAGCHDGLEASMASMVEGDMPAVMNDAPAAKSDEPAGSKAGTPVVLVVVMVAF